MKSSFMSQIMSFRKSLQDFSFEKYEKIFGEKISRKVGEAGIMTSWISKSEDAPIRPIMRDCFAFQFCRMAN